MMNGVGTLAGEKYISLTTFKQDGTPVATPVWVVSDDGRRLLVWTAAQTWKVKRLRRDPRVVVSASDFRGRTRGESTREWGGCSTSRRGASSSRCSTGSTA
jgi:uncharacterized protein